MLPTTIFNSSKFRISFSDWPFHESIDDYPTAAQIFSYLQSYASHFDLGKYYRLDTEVKRIEREQGRWVLEVYDKSRDAWRRERFDRVCVATGTFFAPRFPTLEGIEQFNGRVLHSRDFHCPDQFKGQNVMLIGLHATAQDITHSLWDGQASHVYIAHRSGVLLLPRFGPDGSPTDTTVRLPHLLLQLLFETWCPRLWQWYVNKKLARASVRAYGDLPRRLGLVPYPNPVIATPLMADTIYPHLVSGFAEPTSAIRRLDGDMVELMDGRQLHNVHAIIYCTGYHTCLPEGLFPNRKSHSPLADMYCASQHGPCAYDPYPEGPGQNPYLYMNTFPMTLDPSINKSLAILGQADIIFPAFIQQELQVLVISQVWRNKRRLPPLSTMLAWHSQHTVNRDRKIREHDAPKDGTYHAVRMEFAEYLTWLDSMAGTGLLGWTGCGNMMRLLWTDRELLKYLWSGIVSPTIFMLFDQDGRRPLERVVAKAMLRRDNEIYQDACSRKRKELEDKRLRPPPPAQFHSNRNVVLSFGVLVFGLSIFLGGYFSLFKK